MSRTTGKWPLSTSATEWNGWTSVRIGAGIHKIDSRTAGAGFQRVLEV
ncbi:hypothetical protein QM042_02245 [Escherichia coli]